MGIVDGVKKKKRKEKTIKLYIFLEPLPMLFLLDRERGRI